MVFSTIPCVICGQPRSKTGTARKFKICTVCFQRIKGKEANYTKYHPTCKICGVTISKVKAVPSCDYCRTKYYRIIRAIKTIDKTIKTQTISKLGIRVKDLVMYGYEVTITKVSDPFAVSHYKGKTDVEVMS